jgi:deazaflavin-dependent oxidoreductase (nitroreductase family)
MTNDTQTTNTETTDTYIPSPSDWVREQVETIEATGDTRSVDIMGLPVVLLTMRGKKTGALRKVPLMRVEHDGVYAAVASKGGAPEHPQWYANLLANPTPDAHGRHGLVGCRRARDHGRGARAVVGTLRPGVPELRGVPDQHRSDHPGAAAGAGVSGLSSRRNSAVDPAEPPEAEHGQHERDEPVALTEV